MNNMIIMVATVAVFFDFGGSNGTPATEQDTSSLGPPNLRFKTADDATIDNQNPIPIPSGTAINSFWKQIYLKVTGGTFTQIDNVNATLKLGDTVGTKLKTSANGFQLIDVNSSDAVRIDIPNTMAPGYGMSMNAGAGTFDITANEGTNIGAGDLHVAKSTGVDTTSKLGIRTTPFAINADLRTTAFGTYRNPALI
jgi:hypothetical protein